MSVPCRKNTKEVNWGHAAKRNHPQCRGLKNPINVVLSKLTMLHSALKMETSSSFCLSPKPKGRQDDSHTWHRGMQLFLVTHLLM